MGRQIYKMKINRRARVPCLNPSLGTQRLCTGEGKMVRGQKREVSQDSTVVPKLIGEALTQATIRFSSVQFSRSVVSDSATP